MAFIVETGIGLEDANSYSSVEFATNYHANENLNSDSWATNSIEKQEQGLVTATRLLDDNYDWHGFIEHKNQGLQWPRYADNISSIYQRYYNYDDFQVESGTVPLQLKKATAELARLLLQTNRLADQEVGLKSVNIGVAINFDKKDRIPVIPKYIRDSLRKIGNYSSNNMRLRRS